jgi:hypothetical protein
VYESLVNAGVGPEACRRELNQGNPVSRSYTGLATDSQSVVFLFGGGHGSHPGNDVDLYRVDENRWEVQYEPECPLPGSPEAHTAISGFGNGTSSITPLGRPYVEHTYQVTAWDPVRRRWVGVLSSGRATWAYDPARKQWTILAGPPVGTRSPSLRAAGGLLMYEPVADRFIAIVRAPRDGGKGVYVFDPAANRWTFATLLPPDLALTGINLFAAYNRDRREFYIINYKTSDPARPSKLYRFLPTGYRWVEVASLPLKLRESIPMFDYDTQNHRVVFLVPPTQSAAAVVWVWDPDADVWETLPTPSSAPSGKSMMLRAFVYLSDHNVFVFLQGVTNHCADKREGGCGGKTKTWLYRYKTMPMPPKSGTSEIDAA